MDRADREGARQVGVAESVCCDLNYASLRFMIAAFMVHVTWKGLDMGKGTEK